MGKKKIKSSPPGCLRRTFGSKEEASAGSSQRPALGMAKKILAADPGSRSAEGSIGECLFLHGRSFVCRFRGSFFDF